MLKLIRSLSVLLLVFPPIYIAVRFFRWSLHSLEKEMEAVSSSSRDEN